MNKQKVIVLVLLISFVGFCMMILVASKSINNIRKLIVFSIGVGLLIGPIKGLILGGEKNIAIVGIIVYFGCSIFIIGKCFFNKKTEN